MSTAKITLFRLQNTGIAIKKPRQDSPYITGENSGGADKITAETNLIIFPFQGH